MVSTGSPGSGGEVTAFRILEAVGINPATDIQKQSLGVAQAADALKDGKIDAFFWSGGLPTAAVLDLAHTPGISIRLLSNDDVLPALQRSYGTSLYFLRNVPKAMYPGLERDVPVVSVTIVLAVHESMPPAAGLRHHADAVRASGGTGGHSSGSEEPVAGHGRRRIAGAFP